jgi:chromosome segregation ATPase
MPSVWKSIPRVAIFVAGVAAGALSSRRRQTEGGSTDIRDLRDAVAGLESRLTAQEAASATRLTQIETRLEEHSAQLADVPSTSQIVAAMEQLLSKTMANLDDRLASQAHSFDVLKTTVSQTDGLLERVLESLDSLQSEPSTLAPASMAEKPSA